MSVDHVYTPGKAIVASNNCHSAVRLMSPLGITLEMIVPEKTFGKRNQWEAITSDREGHRPHWGT